jgi:coenzyme F420-reducing hydrogenase beta subunit
MNVSMVKKEKCCGCTACKSVCPVAAICMKSDNQGFLHPEIDEVKCIDCGLCVHICEDKEQQKKPVKGAFAAKNINDDVLIQSSSGGVSHALCKTIIDANGVVYGVAYNAQHVVILKRARNIEECDAFYGSKYVQADPRQTLQQVYEDLQSGRSVLFFGTSCLIAGLLSYLNSEKGDTTNLYTVDLICHGVPSPMLFAEYISFINKNRKLVRFDFRTKKLPWGYGSKNFGCTITYKEGKEETDSAKARLFLNLFFSNNCLRPRCHQCEFAGLDKPADLTLADYWGCAEAEPEFFDEMGVSAVLVHTEKGELLLRQSDELILADTTIEKVSRKQGNLDHPSPASESREVFWKLYSEKGFLAIAKKYGGYDLKGKLKQTKIYKLVRNMH